MEDRAQLRAAAAEQAVLRGHLRRVWGVPGTALGLVCAPAGLPDRCFRSWHYWWQAHLLDCLVDAQRRAPSRQRRSRLRSVVRGHRLRNLGPLTNDYHDDMAWYGLALLRAGEFSGVSYRPAAAVLGRVLREEWDAAPAGGIPWRRGDTFRNAPANGPAAVLLARLGDPARAGAISDWIEANLLDSATGLIRDGVRDGAAEPGDRIFYTYCQGVVLGAETELMTDDRDGRHVDRACRLVRAIAAQLAPGGVLVGCTEGDGGLFAGITARYLTGAAIRLPVRTREQRAARGTAAELVRASAQAAWRHRRVVDGRPRFGFDWSAPAGPAPAELSAQLSAWMLLEGAAVLARSVDSRAG